MEKFVIVGAGATGQAVIGALQQRDTGDEIVLVSRSGSGANIPGVHVAQGDASSADFLANTCKGAAAIFNCVNPLYHRWLTDWPPVAAALLESARRSGAVLTTLSNLYAYGAINEPMTTSHSLTSSLPKAKVRATMWRDALAAHEQGKIRATEVRASDFIGNGSQSIFERGKKSLLAGRPVAVYGNPDMDHSWTFTGDVGRTLVAAATNSAAWGHAWHAVTNPPKTMREVFSDMAKAAGAKEPKLRKLPTPLLRAVGVLNPQARELPKVLYQFESPFVINDDDTRKVLNLVPTDWSSVIADAVRR
jgi:nucleoside-diphosphate-sugar epimerase